MVKIVTLVPIHLAEATTSSPIQKLQGETWKQKKEFLLAHFKQKITNNHWLYECKEGKTESFPYRIAKRQGNILFRFIYPKEPVGETAITKLDEKVPRFIINIPEGKSLSLKPSDERYQKMIKLLKKQSFGKTSSMSIKMIPSRLAIVVGTNQVASLDPAYNRAFKMLIRKTKKVDGLACKRIGFLWEVGYTKLKYEPQLAAAKKCFLLLKAYNSKEAAKVRTLVENPEEIREQVPYGAIRNAILKCRATRSFLDQIPENAAYPVYLTTLDADVLELRSQKEEGIFSKITKEIPLRNPYFAIGVGYATLPDELPFIREAVKIDMAVRRAMSNDIPYSAYLPEPCSFFLLKKPGQKHHLGDLSFSVTDQTLESRRLIQKARSAGVFTEHMKFSAHEVRIDSPERWKTKKNQKNTRLFKKIVKTKDFLTAVRGLSQSHAHPKKWADQIYVALPDFSCKRVTDATQHMMHIFGVYDPISRMFASLENFSSRIFNQVMQAYENPLTNEQNTILQEAKAALRKLKMQEEQIQAIILAAEASGRAIHSELLRLVSPRE